MRLHDDEMLRSLLALTIVLALPPDPLVQTIERLNQETGPSAQDAHPRLETATKALAAGRRLVAVYQVATVLPSIEAAKFANAVSATERNNETTFESAWKRDTGLKSAQELPPLEPALLRGFAEASLLRRRNFYNASLDYARSMTAESGFYYLGRAHGEEALLDLLRTLSVRGGAAPQLRSLGPEIDSLQHTLLSAYHPPASIDRHDDFIGASAVLKEARELDDAGLRYGALLRYLDAAQRTGRITASPSAEPDLREHLKTWREKVHATPGDHSIAQLYVELAETVLDSGKSPEVAASIDSVVLPRYFAALGPASSSRPKPKAIAHVTLVRWPYT